MIRLLYDKAVYYTPEELLNIKGREIDVQQIIQTPEIYLLARASDTAIDKLSYIETTTEDITELKTNLKSDSNVEFTDKMKYFNSDLPEQCYEQGKMEGGDFPCAGCKEKASNFSDLETIIHAGQNVCLLRSTGKL